MTVTRRYWKLQAPMADNSSAGVQDHLATALIQTPLLLRLWHR